MEKSDCKKKTKVSFDFFFLSPAGFEPLTFFSLLGACLKCHELIFHEKIREIDITIIKIGHPRKLSTN